MTEPRSVALDTLALSVLDPERIAAAGLLLVLVIVFVETGLLVGFFLPGDSLLFTVGVLAASGRLDVSIWVLVLTVPLAAVLGDQVGYGIGRRAGPALYSRPDSRFFRRKHLLNAQRYFEAHGGRTIVVVRFIPVLRTFAPVVAGVSAMPYRNFVLYNVLGGVLWGAGVPLVGYLLGGVAVVAANVETIIFAVIVVSTLPVLLELVQARRRGRESVEQPLPRPPTPDLGGTRT